MSITVSPRSVHGVQVLVEILHRLQQCLDRPHVEPVRHRLVVVGGLVMVFEVLDAEVERGDLGLDERVVV